ncbi:hypothetical protein [Cupriavidus sp. D384]|uniref:hypothetical protein n=1 Tax=Cupriavidus sp. D384 TaxID=1538095 RepID=UPI0008295126|nr:hypothetical protein [Cupriavidus sp. D384]
MLKARFEGKARTSRRARACVLAGLALLVALPTAPAWGTEQAQQRRQGRDVRQDTRQGARETKQDCRAADQKSNSACRQDKRQTKQGGREAARDIKY